MAPTSTEFTLQPLSESEIQTRLYGEYHTGQRLRPSVGEPTVTSAKAAPPGPSAEESPWTGEEILKSELQCLTRELAQLRREKERLGAEMARRGYVTASTASVEKLLEAPITQARAGGGAPVQWTDRAPGSGGSRTSLWVIAGLLLSAALRHPPQRCA